MNLLGKVESLYVSGELTHDKFLHVLARAVETNPSDKRHWYMLTNILTSAPPSMSIKRDREAENSRQHWWELRKDEWADAFFHSPPGSAANVKSSFVEIVLDAIEPEICQVKAERENDGLDSCKQEGTPLEMASPQIFSSLLIQNEMPLSADPMCETLCLRVIVANGIFEQRDFVNNSIWWLAVKHWKSCQSNSSNDYLDGLKWLSKRGLNILEYINERHLRL